MKKHSQGVALEAAQAGRKSIYLPDVVGGGFGEFWRSRHRYRVVKGGKGSKKSSTAALWFIVNLMKIPLTNLLVIRKFNNAHYTSTFSQLRWAIARLGVSHLWKIKLAPLEIVFIPTGQQIIFRGLDNPEKLASTTINDGHLCWVWIEEAFEIDREEDFDLLDFSVPRGQVSRDVFKQTTITFNPWNEKHFLKKRFFDDDKKLKKNVFSMNATYLNNEFLDGNDIELFERLRNENYSKYSVIGLGEWGSAVGLVFEHWRSEYFDVDEVCGQDFIKCVFGLDYGYTSDPTAFVAAAVMQRSKKIYIFDEHYERRMLNSKIAEMIIGKGFSKERIYADCAEPKSNEDLRRLGIGRLRSAKKGAGSIMAGVMKLFEFEIIIHPRCINAIREFSNYAWDSATGDISRNCDDHIIDALRYAMEDITLTDRDLQKSFGNSYDRKKVKVRRWL